MNRQNWPDAERYPQANLDALRELGYAFGAVLGAGCFGAMLAYVIWGWK
jgi:hypothetical protein